MERIIKQIIPCNVEMYAIFKNETGETFRKRVLAFALCDDGCIYPQLFDSEIGVDDCDGVYGYELEDGNDNRIADALEAIKSSAEMLEGLAYCITSSKRGNQFCITGDVTAYEP